MSHPIQDTHIINGVFRFKENKIINFMLKKLEEFGYDLNELYKDCYDFDKDDWDQFNQLIGYSVSGAPISNDIVNLVYESEEQGISLEEANTKLLESRLKLVKDNLKDIVSELFNVHPDDLT